MDGRTTIETVAVLAVVGLGVDGPVVGAQEPTYDEAYDTGDLAAHLWFDRGEEPLLERGERVRVYYRTNYDAYVAIFNIDTDGTARLVYPSSPAEGHYVRGGRDYRLLLPGSEYWYVDDHPGMGYYFIIASPEPFDFSAVEYSYYDRGWDLTRVGRTVYSDPYVAMDDYVAALIPDWEYVAYALDFSTYHVGAARYDYPRFLCYDCHGFRPYSAWNPYHFACSTFRVVVYTDPWYYPSFRYRGTRVVYTRPPRPFSPRFDFKERVRGDPVGVEYVTRPPVADRPGVAGDPVRRRSADERGSVRVTGRPGADPAAGSGSRASRPGVPPALGRPMREGSGTRSGGRPSNVLPGRGDPRGSGPVTGPPTSVLPRSGEGVGSRRVVPPRGSGGRPVLERRPRGGGNPPAAGGSPRGTPPVRSSPPGSGSGSTPPVRSSAPPTSGSGRATPPPVRRSGGEGGGSGAVTPERRPTSRGTSDATSRSVPVLGGEPETPRRRWVPVLGERNRPTGRSGDESPPERIQPRAGSNGSSSARRSSEPGIEVVRGGVRGDRPSDGSVTRSGGIRVTRGRMPSSRPSSALGGEVGTGRGSVRGTSPPPASRNANGARSGSRRSPGAVIPRGRANTRPGGASPGATRPSTTRVLPGRSGSASPGRATSPPRGGVGRTSPPRTSRPPSRGSGPPPRTSRPPARGSGSPPAASRPPARGSRSPPAASRGSGRSSGAAGAAGATRPPVRRGGRGGGSS